jgi:BON domain-containing protein
MLSGSTLRRPRGFRNGLCAAALALGGVVPMASPASAQQPRTYQLDPFTQATSGYPGCPEQKPPVLTEEEMRVSAHGRVERGTSCCLAGTCECGGAYKRDPEINERVAAAIRADAQLANTSVWVTTTRKFVTLSGCVRSKAQKKALERLVKRQSDVAIVWNETSVGTRPAKKPGP